MRESTKKNSIVLGVVFLLLLLSLLVYKGWREGIYDKSLGINLVVVGEDSSVAIMILRPVEQMVSWIKLPSDLKVKIYNSQATYPINSLWKYGEMEKNGYDIVGRTIGTSVGIVVSGTVKIDKSTTIENLLGSLHRIGLKTDLSVRDRWLIRSNLSELISSRRLLELDIPKNTYDKVAEPDGKEFFVFNSIISLWSKNKFVFEKVSKENVDAYVTNASSVAGMGVVIAKQLESSGLRVVEVKTGNFEESKETGCFYSIKGSYPVTEMFVSTYMKCSLRHLAMEEDSTMDGLYLWVK